MIFVILITCRVSEEVPRMVWLLTAVESVGPVDFHLWRLNSTIRMACCGSLMVADPASGRQHPSHSYGDISNRMRITNFTTGRVFLHNVADATGGWSGRSLEQVLSLVVAMVVISQWSCRQESSLKRDAGCRHLS